MRVSQPPPHFQQYELPPHGPGAWPPPARASYAYVHHHQHPPSFPQSQQEAVLMHRQYDVAPPHPPLPPAIHPSIMHSSYGPSGSVAPQQLAPYQQHHQAYQHEQYHQQHQQYQHQQYYQQHQQYPVNISSTLSPPSYHHPAHAPPPPPARQWRDGKIPLTSEGRWGRAHHSSSSSSSSSSLSSLSLLSWGAPNNEGGAWRGSRGRGRSTNSTSSFFASRGRNNSRGGRGGRGGGEGAYRGEGGLRESQYHNEEVSTSAATAKTTAPAPDPAVIERVKCVIEQMHLVAPFLSPAEGLQMSGVLRSWMRPYREVTRELRVGEPPSGTAVSGHWTSLLNLLSSLTNLETLRVTHYHSVFGVTKCLGYRLTQRLTCLELSHAKMWRTDAGRLIDALAQKFLPSLERLLLVDCGLGDRAIEHLAVAILSGGCRKLVELEMGDNSFRDAVLNLATALNSTWVPSAGEEEEEGNVPGGCCPQLRLLGLGGNALQKEGAEWLVEGLSGGNVGDEAGMGRSSNLMCLTELNIVECGLELEGMEALCPGLRQGPLSRLTALRLNANRLGDAGMALLASALSEGASPGILELDVGANYLSDNGLRALLDVVKTGRGLQQLRRLNLSFNFLTPEAVWALLECCDGGEGGREDAGGADGGLYHQAAWGCLQHCDLYMNEITAKERAELQVAIKERAPALDCFM